MEQVNRRTFLKQVATAAGAGALAVWWSRTGEAADAPAAPAAAAPAGNWLSLGKTDDFPLDTMKPVKVGTNHAGKLVEARMAVLRTKDGVHVISTHCTHWGCTVKIQDDKTFLCPCHRGRYDASGQVTKGPPKKPLEWYEAKLSDAGEVMVNKDKTVPAPG